MSMTPWDPFLHGRRISLWPFSRNPFNQVDQILDRFFDDTMNVQLRDHAAQFNITDKGDLTYKVDVSGFRPEELNVEMQGNQVIVKGDHREENQGESVHRQFTRRVLIPENIAKESVKCKLERGRLVITGMKEVSPGQEGRPIPIEIKKGAAVEGADGQEKLPTGK